MGVRKDLKFKDGGWYLEIGRHKEITGKQKLYQSCSAEKIIHRQREEG